MSLQFGRKLEQPEELAQNHMSIMQWTTPTWQVIVCYHLSNCKVYVRRVYEAYRDVSFWSVYLLGSQHHGHHTLWLSGLGALVDQNGAELHLCQARVPGSHAGAADHICVLDNNEKEEEHLSIIILLW